MTARKFIKTTITLSIMMALIIVQSVVADNVKNDVVSDPAAITLIAGDASSYNDVNFYIQPISGDGDPQCNFDTMSEYLTFTINTPSGVTANPASLTFNKCKEGGTDNSQTVRFSANASAGSGNISFTETFNNSGGTFTYAQAVFYIKSVNLPSDTTPPTLHLPAGMTVEATRPSGAVVNFTATADDVDPAHPAVSCSPSSGSTFGLGTTTVNCSAADTAGNTAYGSFTVTVQDTTPPTLHLPAGMTVEATGPSGAVVNFTATADDVDPAHPAVSCSPSSGSTFGLGTTTVNCSAADTAGNTAYGSFTVTVQDTTPPAITFINRTPAENSNGWNNADVTVTWSCTDLVGVLSDSVSETVSAEGAGQSATGTCEDTFGNTASDTQTGINIDKTAPTASASALPAPNAAGWNNTNVTVSFSGDDDLSGIDFCDAPVVLSTEGAGQSASGTCTDEAGNLSALATASGINIDKTAPSIIWNGGPADGASYYFGFVPAAPTCAADDSLSGPNGCNVTGYGASIGSHTLTAIAYDVAGNSAVETRSYTVLAWTLKGFYQPVDMGGVLNTVKGGSTVPFKFEIFTGLAELTNTDYVIGFSAAKTTCDLSVIIDPIEVTATGGTSLRYDPIAGQFVYNWQTPKTPGICYRVTLTALDGSTLSANFKLK